MLLGRARGEDADRLDVVTAEAVLPLHLDERVDARVTAAVGRVRLEADRPGLPRLAESRGQQRPVAARRERGQVAPVLALEERQDPGEPSPRQQAGVDAALRGAPGVEPLHHRPELGRHQTARLGARDAERMLHLPGRQSQQRATGRRRAQGAVGPGGMPAGEQVRRAHRHPDPRRHLVPRDHRGQESRARAAPQELGHRERRGGHHGAGVDNRALVKVVQLESVHHRPVHERGSRRRRRGRQAPKRARTGRLQLAHAAGQDPGPGERRAEQPAADGVEEAELGVLDDGSRDIVESERRGKRRQPSGVAVDHRVFCGCPHLRTDRRNPAARSATSSALRSRTSGGSWSGRSRA